jgi:hypothetical protein
VRKGEFAEVFWKNIDWKAQIVGGVGNGGLLMLLRGKQCRRHRRILADPGRLREISSRYLFDPSLYYFIFGRNSFSFVLFSCGSSISGSCCFV